MLDYKKVTHQCIDINDVMYRMKFFLRKTFFNSKKSSNFALAFEAQSADC